MTTNAHFLSYRAHFFSERKMFQTNVVEEIKTHILCSETFFFFENCAVYEIILKNVVDPDRPQMTIRSMRFAYWMSKATHTHTNTQYVILIVFTRLIVTFIRTLPVFFN